LAHAEDAAILNWSPIPDELHEAIQAIHAGGGYDDVAEDNGGEKGEASNAPLLLPDNEPPDGRAIDSLLDRIFGKSVRRIAGGDGGPIQFKG
jgi:hypothetical protein